METRKVIILGSGPAGYTAAIYTARAGMEPLLIEGPQPGGQLTITTDVENYPGYFEGVQGPVMMQNFRKQAERFGTSIITGTAEKVDLSKRPFTLTVDGKDYKAETLIISTGASARWLGLESEKKLYSKGVSACATCDGFFFKNQVVVVVGGGDTAMEEALFLTHFAKEVYVVHRRDQLRASEIMQNRVLKNEKIKVVWDSVVDEILGVEEGKVTGVKIRNVKTNEITKKDCEGVFIAIGHRPNSDLFKGQLELDEQGYIETVPNRTATNIDGVFAAGDVMDHYYRQAITAAGTGCMAAIEAERYLAAL